MRYFVNKEGLFAAAADVDLELPALQDIPRRHWEETLVRQFLDRWEGPERTGSLRMLFRVAPTNAVAAERLGQAVSAQVATMLERADVEHAQRRADLMASQMLGLAYSRYVLRLPTVAAAMADDLVSQLAPTMQRLLVRPEPDR
jgi:AcrR family transcriptional regulator